MLVLLVHGLGRTPLSLFGLAAALRRAKHRTRFFAYSATFESFPRVSDRLANRLRTFARGGWPIGLVGHSLGGLLLRHALARVPELRPHHLMMLGTPNCGSLMARLARRWRPFRLFARDCGGTLATLDEFKSLPEPNCAYTTIAGTAGPCGRWSPFGNEPNDGIVSVTETTIDPAAVVQLPVLHSFMMDSPAVRARILGTFDEYRRIG